MTTVRLRLRRAAAGLTGCCPFGLPSCRQSSVSSCSSVHFCLLKQCLLKGQSRSEKYWKTLAQSLFSITCHHRRPFSFPCCHGLRILISPSFFVFFFSQTVNFSIFKKSSKKLFHLMLMKGRAAPFLFFLHSPAVYSSTLKQFGGRQVIFLAFPFSAHC